MPVPPEAKAGFERDLHVSLVDLLEKGSALMSQLMIAPSLFCIEISTPPLLVALRCAGDIDIASVDTLERALKASVETGAAALEVDLRAVEFLDGTAIKALLAAQSALAQDGRSLRVRVRPCAAVMFRAVGLADVLNVRPE
jgi:anti-anti-sigma factor